MTYALRVNYTFILQLYAKYIYKPDLIVAVNMLSSAIIVNNESV